MNVRNLFQSFHLQSNHNPISDYGGIDWSVPSFTEIHPKNQEEVCEILEIAKTHKIPLRIRGNGHSMNGSSLPTEGELLVKSTSLDSYRFDEPGSITVGAGVSLWDLNQFLLQYGSGLYIYNDGGGAASTLGGYISAGGIGSNPIRRCGFWETVLEIVLASPGGKITRCKKGDELFPWIFGSMGQFGIIVEAKIEIIDRFPIKYNYPQGEVGKITPSELLWEPLFWFTLFSPLEKEKEAIQELSNLEKKCSSFLTLKEKYRYVFNFLTFTPQLVYPHPERFVANGMWGELKGTDRKAILQIEKQFHNLVLSRPYFRRYIQTEVVSPEMNYEQYFGAKIYQQFLALKMEFDPLMLIDRGLIFD